MSSEWKISELDLILDKLVPEFDLLAKKIPESKGEPEKVELYKVNLEEIENPRVKAPDHVAVHLVLVLVRTREGGKEFIEAVRENSYDYKEKIMGLPGFTQKLDGVLKELGFKKDEYPVEGQRDLDISLSHSFWKKEIGAKVVPKVRI